MPAKDPSHATRDKLLDAAEQLMLSKGFVATSVDEICAGAEVTKGSFFHYFPTKEQLGKVLLERFAARQAERFREACLDLDDPLDRIYRIIDGVLEAGRDPGMKGCLIGTFAQEISDTHPALREICGGTFEAFGAVLSRDLILAKERHAPGADFDAASLGAYFVALFQGSILLAKSTQSRAQIETNLSHLKSYLRSLYGR